jgi:Ran GTPase-activating protein (RanGAP) involved in mRNA processing and transport
MLTTLDVSGNNFFKEGAAALAAPLAVGVTTLTAFSIASNWIAPEGVAHLAPALRANAGLAALSLRQNGLGAEGCRLLAQVAACAFVGALLVPCSFCQ